MTTVAGTSPGADVLRRIVTDIPSLDPAAMAAATARMDRLTKPPGSLGRLEALAIQLAGIRGHVVTEIARPVVVVFAADHGVAAQGISPYPAEVTRQMVANFLGGGAAINVLARVAGAEVVVVDVGVSGERLPPPGPDTMAVRFVDARVRDGTRDLSIEPAMTADEVAAALDAGARVAHDLVADGADLLAFGDMGIGNTTASSAIVAALTGRDPRAVTGRGTGLDDAGVVRKAALIQAALSHHRLDAGRPLEVVAAVGGLEIAALTGATLAAAAARVPVLLDGFITGAAALVAARLAPELRPRLIASHRSAEPGHRVVLEELRAEPLLDLGLRLGEGSGAALAIPVVRAASRILGEMATFEEAGVSGRETTPPASRG